MTAKFHIVDRLGIPGEPEVLRDVPRVTLRYALYRRAEGFKLGGLIAVFSSRSEAECTLLAVQIAADAAVRLTSPFDPITGDLDADANAKAGEAG